MAGALERRIQELRGPGWAERILGFHVVDPACGDGALLRVAAERLSAEAQRVGVPVDAVLRNLHGVDRDPHAVAACDVGDVRVGESLLGQDWGRYDVVLMNPPYVKLQALRRDDPGFVEALRGSDYASAKTGHVDLYLPFLELGVRLLKPGGRMGAIAPSLWIRNAYGAGLRGWIAERGALERWVEVEGQAFASATTYTALQFFRDRGDGAVALEGAESGTAATPGSEPWTFLGDAAQAELATIRARSQPLSEVAERIFVGVQTSADAVYQVEALGAGRYRTRGGDVVELEDAVVRPLLSGPDVGRYSIGGTRALLMPYDGDRLRSAAEFATRFPQAWSWLRRNEAVLRARERGRMDRDDRWWGFNYPKNLARQGVPKLVVAQTVPGMRVAADPEGRWTLNNVRVNAVQARDEEGLWFLLAVLNASAVDRVFRWTARPKRGGWYEANKQFLAPLPVPRVTADERAALAELGRRRNAGEDLDGEINARVAAALGVDP